MWTFNVHEYIELGVCFCFIGNNSSPTFTLLPLLLNRFRVAWMLSVPVCSSGSIPDADGSGGLEPVLYWSFNTLDGLTLKEGTQQKNFDALIDGKVGSRTIM